MRLLSSTAFLVPFVILGCSGQSTAPIGSSGSGLTGPVQMQVTNASDTDTDGLVSVMHVVVTITRIDARVGDEGWRTILATPMTVDLLSLRNGTITVLGVASLPVGQFEQLRLFIAPTGAYVTTTDGVKHTLQVPTEPVQIVGDFDEMACSTGHITFDFPGKLSVVMEKDSNGADIWVLNPVIHLHEVVTGCPDESEHGADGHGNNDDHGRS